VVLLGAPGALIHQAVISLSSSCGWECDLVQVASELASEAGTGALNVGRWLESHPAEDTAGATIVLVLVTAQYVRLTRTLAQASVDQLAEARRALEAQYRLYVSLASPLINPAQESVTVTAHNETETAGYFCIAFITGLSEGQRVWRATGAFNISPRGDWRDSAKLQSGDCPPHEIWGTDKDEARIVFCQNIHGRRFRCINTSLDTDTWAPIDGSPRHRWVDWYEKFLEKTLKPENQTA
jgi:hypothetical protein